jgi:hypothetical protein
MVAANVGPAHLSLQCQHRLSIIFARCRTLFRLSAAKEPIAPLIDVPSSVDTRSVRGVHRQVAQRHILEERSHCWRTDLCRIRRVRRYDMCPNYKYEPVKSGTRKNARINAQTYTERSTYLFEPQTNSLSSSSSQSLPPTRNPFAFAFRLEG